MNKEELKKGCGERVSYWKTYCGQIEDLKHSDHIIYCDECRAKLEGYEMCKKEAEKEKEDLKKRLLEKLHLMGYKHKFNKNVVGMYEFKKVIEKVFSEKQEDKE